MPGTAPPLLLDAYALAQRLARDDADAGSAATNAEVGALFGRLAELSPLLSYAGATERSADDVPRLKGELDWARTSLAEASAYSESLQATLRQSEPALHEAQRYAESLQATLQRKDEALAIAQNYADDLNAALGRKDDALATAQAYNDDLRSALRGKDEAVATAQVYNDDLLATLKRKDEELSAAHTTLERIRERLLGRMLLRRIERARDRR